MATTDPKIRFLEAGEPYDNDGDDNENNHDDNDNDPANNEEENENNVPNDAEDKTIPSATLSKAWNVKTAHVPTFTGGKVAICQNMKTIKNIDNDDDDNNNNNFVATPQPFLLLPVGGDLAIVDSQRGVKLGTIRGDDAGVPTNNDNIVTTTSNNNNNNSTGEETDYFGDDDDDEDGVDLEGITSYALANGKSNIIMSKKSNTNPSNSDNNPMIITCTRNQLIRQYTIDTSAVSSSSLSPSSSSSSLVTLIKSFGKSGHTLPVTHMEFHLSNVFLATGSVDGTVRIWDMRGGFVTHVFRPYADSNNANASGNRKSVTSIQWRNDITKLIIAIGRNDGSITIHDLRQEQDNKKHDSAVLLRDHVSAVTCMDWYDGDNNNNNDIFVSAGRDAVLSLWRITTGKVTKKKSKKNKKQATSRYTVEKERDEYKRIHTMALYEQIEGMVILPNKDRHHDSMDKITIVTAGTKGNVRVWQSSSLSTTATTPLSLTMIKEQSASHVFGEDRGGYTALLLSNNNNNTKTIKRGESNTLIVADAEHNLSFLKVPTLEIQRTLVGNNDDILDLKIIPTNHDATTAALPLYRSIVVATNSPQLRLFRLDNFSCTAVLDGHSATILTIDVSPCGTFVASCGKDKTMRLWNLKTCQCVAIATGHTEPIGACALSKKVGRYEVGGKAAQNGGGAFAITASVDRTIKRWNLPGSNELQGMIHDDDHNKTDDKDDENMDVDDKLFELEAAYSVVGHDKDINITSIAPNDSLIATGSQDKTVKLWKATDLSLIATLKGHKRGVWDCQFSPIDRVLVTCSGDKTIKLWSLSDYSCVRTFQGHVGSVLRVRFLNGGLQLISSGGDGLVKLWTIRTNECEATLDHHRDKVWALDLKEDFSIQQQQQQQDGGNNDNNNDVAGAAATATTCLVSGGADSQIIVWKDVTQQVQDEKRKEEAEKIVLSQKLANHLRNEEFDKALDIALQLDQPRHTLKVLTSIIERDVGKINNNVKSTARSLSFLNTIVSGWDMDRTLQVLKLCREWNTRARNSHVAMTVVNSIVSCIPVTKLVETNNGIPEILAGLVPYAERHFDRIERLYVDSYLLDFALTSMGTVLEDSNDNDDFETWQSKSRLVLPPATIDGRIQIGGKDIVGSKSSNRQTTINDNGEIVSMEDDDDDVATVGDSDSSSDDDDDGSSSASTSN